MNVIWMFFPILIILLLVIGVSVLMVRMSRRRRMGPKKARWIIGAYLIVLLVGTVFSFFIVEDQGHTFETVTTKEMERIERTQMKVMDAAHSGRLSDFKDVYTEKKSWSFPYTDQKLDITNVDEQSVGVMVFVQKKEKEDGIVEAVHYTGDVYLDGIDVTEEKSTAELELKGEALVVKAPPMVHLNITTFSSGFPFQQFSKGKGGLFSDHRSMGFGQDFILLKVPPSVKVNGQTNYVRSE
ncbi:hypothetical protein LCM10_12135 [Rossellomorea aquimaris]|uniref:hypothetical protein n=1 Tax=Rossellomorea aquimaris TaxID=189382 RepID=UPI001CD64508|nr:hypothetical protein [Rossellomorea aquimaris]MCA1055736.1 hypothetical protein [Rossellomorea aquimaris]